MENSILDRAPLSVRLVAVVVSLVIFILVSAITFDLLDQSWLLRFIAVMVTALLLYLILRKSRSLLESLKPQPFSWSSEPKEACRVLTLDLKSGRAEEASRELARLMEERAKRTTAKYALITSLSGSLSKSILAILADEETADREASILKKLIPSTIPGFRVREESGLCVDGFRDFIRRLELSFSSPIIHTPAGQSYCRWSDDSKPLGEILDSLSGEFKVSKVDLSKHIGVFGSTGSGKSSTLSKLAVVAESLGYTVVVLDWTGEYPSLLEKLNASFKTLSPARGEASINPLESVEDEEILLNIMSKALSLTGPQSYMLMKIIENFKPRNLRDLESRIEELPDESRWDKEVKRALIRRIAVLTRNSYTAFSRTTIPELHGLTLIALNDIRGWIARRSYALFFLAYLFAEREKNRGGYPLLVVLDEAHNVFLGEESIFIEQLFGEARKYGLSLAIASQSPSSIPNNILLNTNMKIIHALKSARDKTVIADTLSLTQDYIEILDKLEPGVAVIHSPSCNKPTLVRIKL